MANILITGGSGLVGRAISEKLIQKGHEVRWLSREEGKDGKIIKYEWDLKRSYIQEKAFDSVDAIIHLAGAGIMDKAWTKSYKKEILDSRVRSSDLLFNCISKNNYPIKTFVGGSAIGYYGSEKSNHVFTEGDAAGSDFLSKTCVDWERTYESFAVKGIRTSVIRTGIVLSKNGGAYPKLLGPFNLGLGTAIGSGHQAFPWIHLNDLAEIFLKATFDEKMKGIYNAVVSIHVNNYEFSKALAKSLNKAFFLPNIPAFLLHLALGERALTLTKGVKVSNAKIKSTGFIFEYDDLKTALAQLA